MSDKMREEFEKDYGQIYLQKEADGSYSGPYAQIAWKWWQKAWAASRAALVVNLPSRALVELSSIDDHTGIHDMDGYYESNDVHQALDNAGVRYD